MSSLPTANSIHGIAMARAIRPTARQHLPSGDPAAMLEAIRLAKELVATAAGVPFDKVTIRIIGKN